MARESIRSRLFPPAKNSHSILVREAQNSESYKKMTRHLHKISRYTPSILQGTLQLEVTRPRTGLARELSLERHAVFSLSVALSVLVAAYLYFVASSVLNVMAQSDAEHNMRAIEGSMGALE